MGTLRNSSAMNVKELTINIEKKKNGNSGCPNQLSIEIKS